MISDIHEAKEKIRKCLALAGSPNENEAKTALLTAQDRHGIYDRDRVRRLTPKEYWRLQGFPDWAYERVRPFTSDSQLYKQAGNSVTVQVIEEIARKLADLEISA